MEVTNETARVASPSLEIVRTETPVISISVSMEVNNVPATSVDLGIRDASVRQDSMSIARKAHHDETTARQDSMSIAGIVYNGAPPVDNPLGPKSEAQASSTSKRDIKNEPVNDTLRHMSNDNH